SVIGLLVWGVIFYLAAWRFPENPKLKRMVPFLIILLLLYFAYFKYLPLAKNAFVHSATSIENVIIPLGISYSTFKLIHFLTYSSGCRFLAQPPHLFFLYLFFFPIYGAGPIERFDNFVKNRQLHWDPIFLSQGATRIAYGLIKKFAIIGPLETLLTSAVP